MRRLVYRNPAVLDRQQATHNVSLDALEKFAALATAAESPNPEGDALTGLLGVLTKWEQEVIFLRMAAIS